MADPRVFISDSLTAGAALALDGERARHLSTVLRLGAGAAIRVFNPVDGEWRARIGGADRKGLVAHVEAPLRPAQAARDLDLLFAPVKRHASDLIAEKATELGVRRMRPVITQRTIAQTVRRERLAHIAREAAEQSERFDVPEILDAEPLSKALDGWDGARILLFADEAGDDAAQPWGGESGRAPPIFAAVSALRTEKLAVLIGPEGGFDPRERSLLRALPFVVAASLGPRILRAETAAIAALSVIQAAWGDWR